MNARDAIRLIALIAITMTASGCAPLMCPFAIPGTQGAQECAEWEESQRQEGEERQLKLAPPASLRIWYIGTYGKAGHHMTAEPRARCGPGSEMWYHSTASMVGGSLPPGLRLQQSRIAGTPEQPGRWQAQVRFTGLNCRGRTYPDQDVTVDLFIEGLAPRRVR